MLMMVGFMSNIYKRCTIIIFFLKICFFYNYIANVERTEEVENINDQNHGDGYREQGLLLNVIFSFLFFFNFNLHVYHYQFYYLLTSYIF